MNRYISKTIAEIENLAVANRARNDVDADDNSNKNAFVYDTNAKNFVLNHVTQSLIPASRRVDVGKVPYDLRSLRRILNSGFKKAPHAPSLNIPNAVIAEVNRRMPSKKKAVNRARDIKALIENILEDAAGEAEESYSGRLLKDAYQSIVMAVYSSKMIDISSNTKPQSVFRPVHRKTDRFQISGRLDDDGTEIIADVHMGIKPLYSPPAVDYEIFWIVRSPAASWTVTFKDPVEDVETRVRASSDEARRYFHDVIVPGFEITEPFFV